MSRTDKNFIMIVDDDPDTLSFLKTLLSTKYPSRVILTAQSGLQCLKNIEKISFSYPSIVLTDFQMSSMNGAELKDKLRRKYPGLKIVLFTALSRAISGFDFVILKPVSIDDLFSCIDDLSR